jgi:hypothetical protein
MMLESGDDKHVEGIGGLWKRLDVVSCFVPTNRKMCN